MHYILIVVMVIVDQISKFLAYSKLRSFSAGIELIPSVFGLKYIENTGAAFSLFRDKKIFLTVFPLIAIVYLFYLMLKSTNKGHMLASYGFMFIISGALGNLIDRIFRGAVIDFFELRFIKFPIFNIADLYVTAGVIIVSICLIFGDLEGEII